MNRKTAYICIIIPSLLNIIIGLMLVTSAYITVVQGLIYSVIDLSPVLITYAVISLLLEKKTKKNILISKIMALAVLPIIVKYAFDLVGFDGLGLLSWRIAYSVYNISIIYGCAMLFKSYKGSLRIIVPTLLIMLNGLHLINKIFANVILKHYSQGIFYGYRAGIFLVLDSAILVMCVRLLLKEIKNHNKTLHW